MPYLVEEKYAAPYRENENIVHPEFYGMISNIDLNFGRLRKKLSDWGIEDNTVLIFMTDNGTSGGCEFDGNEHVLRGYNAGIRGLKTSHYDGWAPGVFLYPMVKRRLGGRLGGSGCLLQCGF